MFALIQKAAEMKQTTTMLAKEEISDPFTNGYLGSYKGGKPTFDGWVESYLGANGEKMPSGHQFVCSVSDTGAVNCPSS